MASSAVAGKVMTMTVEGSALAESREFTIHFSQDVIDITSRDSSWWREGLASIRDWSIDFAGLLIVGDLAKKYLQHYFTDKTPATLTIVITLDAAETYTLTGECILTSLDYSGGYDGAQEASGSLQGTSTLTPSLS